VFIIVLSSLANGMNFLALSVKMFTGKVFKYQLRNVRDAPSLNMTSALSATEVRMPSGTTLAALLAKFFAPVFEPANINRSGAARVAGDGASMPSIIRLTSDRAVGEGDAPSILRTMRFTAPVNFSHPVNLPPSNFLYNFSASFQASPSKQIIIFFFSQC